LDLAIESNMLNFAADCKGTAVCLILPQIVRAPQSCLTRLLEGQFILVLP
jgi:hypothetical protein